MKKICCLLCAGIIALTASIVYAEGAPWTQAPQSNYYFPPEDETHEGTWLTWPHQYTYGIKYRKEIEGVWIEMTDALHKGEKVHIVAYSNKEKRRITALLKKAGIDRSKVDFVIAKSDDVWARDTGPMFVFDQKGRLTIADFGFDGWGGKTPYKNDDKIPQAVASAKKLPIVKLPGFVLEGGAVELDGSGTVLAAKSSVISKNRNAGMTLKQAEAYLTKYLGASNFIWLEGVTDQDITDAHIDGMARFYDDKTLLTVSEDDFFNLYEDLEESDYEELLNAKNSRGEPYERIELPMTAENVKGLNYKGTYLNYYVGNKVILVPVYNDDNDESALEILAELYDDREVVPIDVTALYRYGGMLHCVTQQQPAQ